ncbi:MAG: alpha/beta hydrolase [Pseudomonadales bacterium]|nr:alpha/beta hydrolase [Pseudomonadales bacterium]
MKKRRVGPRVTLVLLTLVALGAWLYQGDLPAEAVDAKYTSPTSQFLTLDDGARIHFRDEGNRTGLPIVLVHGSMASLHTWEPWVARLGETYRIVTLDLPAHGLTGAVPSADYSSTAQLRTVQAVTSHLNLEQFVLGGNSMGGGVSWRYALEYPESVLALILVDASGPAAWYQARREAKPDKASPLAFKLLGQSWFRAIAARIDPYYLAVQGAKSAYNDSPVVTDALIMRYYELALRAGTRDAILGRFNSWQGPGRQSEDLTVLTQPTLILWGREDSVISVATADQFQAAMPHSEVIIYDGVGHAPMEEVPERSAEDVRRFLRALNRDGV